MLSLMIANGVQDKGSTLAANKNTIRWALAAALTALALVHLGAAVYNWLYGGATWYLFGFIKIRLHQWQKPWLSGIGYFAAAVAIRPGGFFPAFAFRAIFDPWRFRGPSFWRPWAVVGAAAGFGLGMYISHCWHYLFPTFLYTLPFVTVVAAALAGLALGAAKLVEKLPVQDDRYRQGLLQGIVEILLLALVYWPLSKWEGFFTDPNTPLYMGAGLALVHIWGIGLLQRYQVLAGPRKKIILGCVAVGLISAMTISQLRYRAQVHGPAPHDRVIFITLDTTRADHISAYGYPRQTSPNIDAVARTGARFAFAICPMGTTDPSHASMFTGTYPRTHGSVDVSFPITGKVASLPDYFAERGFATACVTSRFRLDPTNVLNLPGFADEYVLRGHAEQTSAPAAFRRAVNWLDRHRDQDVFLWVHFFDPHQTYKPHPGFPTRFTDSTKECDPDRLLAPGVSVSKEEVQRCVDLYDGEIAYMDFYVGKLLDYVNAMEPTGERPPLIVLVADHGEVLGEHQDAPIHYGFGHGDVVYNETAWIPMIISWPGKIKPAVIGGVAENLDLAPTLVDYVFDRSDFVCQGKSLRPEMEGRQPPFTTAVIQRSIRDTEGKPSKDDEGEATHQAVARRYRYEPLYGFYSGHDKLRVFTDGSSSLTNVLVDPSEALPLEEFFPDEASRLAALFAEWKKNTPETKPQQPSLDADQRAVLRALGYIQ